MNTEYMPTKYIAEVVIAAIQCMQANGLANRTEQLQKVYAHLAAAPALPAVDAAMVERALSAPMPPGHGAENVRGTFSGLFDEDVAMHTALTAVLSGPTAQEEGK